MAGCIFDAIVLIDRNSMWHHRLKLHATLFTNAGRCSDVIKANKKSTKTLSFIEMCEKGCGVFGVDFWCFPNIEVQNAVLCAFIQNLHYNYK